MSQHLVMSQKSKAISSNHYFFQDPSITSNNQFQDYALPPKLQDPKWCEQMKHKLPIQISPNLQNIFFNCPNSLKFILKSVFSKLFVNSITAKFKKRQSITYQLLRTYTIKQHKFLRKQSNTIPLMLGC